MPNVRFVGRDQELRALAAAYAAADGGAASLVVVGGDAGVGKTRLLAEFTGTLDALVLRGGCLPLGATGLPFSPIVEVLRALTDDRLPPVLARLVPGLPAGASPGPSSQAELFQAFLGLLEHLAAARTVVLVLEDLHWADRSTCQLLAFVAHALRTQRLCVATYRADDLHRQHPLRPLLAELRRNRRARQGRAGPVRPRRGGRVPGRRHRLPALAGDRDRRRGPDRGQRLLHRGADRRRRPGRPPCPSRSATCSWSGSRPWTHRPGGCCGWRRPPAAGSTRRC